MRNTAAIANHRQVCLLHPVLLSSTNSYQLSYSVYQYWVEGGYTLPLIANPIISVLWPETVCQRVSVSVNQNGKIISGITYIVFINF